VLIIKTENKISNRDLSVFYDAAKAIVDSCSLLSAEEIRRLFPNASLFRERFFGLTKSLIVTEIGWRRKLS
jgi:hypothetical protein